MIDQKKNDPGTTPAQELPDDKLEDLAGGARPLSPRPLNPQPLPPIHY